VQEAASRGLPVVATALLARQLGWADGTELLAAEDADGFAARCAQLLADPALWHALRQAALDRLAQDTAREDFTATLLGALDPDGRPEAPGLRRPAPTV
jgi:O-antigen biosynthesis protein